MSSQAKTDHDLAKELARKAFGDSKPKAAPVETQELAKRIAARISSDSDFGKLFRQHPMDALTKGGLKPEFVHDFMREIEHPECGSHSHYVSHLISTLVP